MNEDVAIDHGLADGEMVGRLTALHTPGHAADHLCYATANGLLFTGDHVMTWSTSVVSPPHGDMAAYFASLDRLAARADRYYLPGHGPLLGQTAGFAGALLAHRKEREEVVGATLKETPAAIADLTAGPTPGSIPGCSARPSALCWRICSSSRRRAGRGRRTGSGPRHEPAGSSRRMRCHDHLIDRFQCLRSVT